MSVTLIPFFIAGSQWPDVASNFLINFSVFFTLSFGEVRTSRTLNEPVESITTVALIKVLDLGGVFLVSKLLRSELLYLFGVLYEENI